MIVGVPKEIKIHEYRVGLTPDAVREYVANGHEVIVETGAGGGIGAGDADYEAAGARIADGGGAGVRAGGDDRQGQGAAACRMRDAAARQILFTYLHLAPDPAQTAALLRSGCTAVAYETVTDERGGPAAAGADERSGRAPLDRGGGRIAAPVSRAARACCSAACRA